MPELNLDQIHLLEEQFIKLNAIDEALKSPQSILQKTVDKFAVLPALYTNESKLDELLKEVNTIIESIAQKGQVRGRVLSQKTMKKFLEDSERRQLTQRTIDAIDRANTRRAVERMSMYTDEMLLERGLLKSEIGLFKKRAKIAGFSAKEINKQLVKAARDRNGPVQAFQKRIRSLESAVLRREASSAEIDEMHKVAKAGEPWQWIAINTKPCPDCQVRAGKVLPYAEWVKLGLPGSGRTVCGSFCMCKLYPVSVSDDLFPTVKEFRFDKNKGVLTTAGEARTLNSKKAKPVQKAVK